MPDRKYRLVIFGMHTASWARAFAADAAVWRLTPEIESVTQIAENDAAAIAALADTHSDVVVMPLMERHIVSCPRRGLTLFPDAGVVKTLSDKSCFADYVAREGLSALCPGVYSGSEIAFPGVLKRLDLNAGQGIAVVRSAEELQSMLSSKPWVGEPYLLQEFVASPYDYVTHLVLRQGRILWHSSFRYAVDAEDPIRRPGNSAAIERHAISADTLAWLGRFLEPLAYDGPLCVDYGSRQDGTLCIYEINPRLGGSLMNPAYVEDLAGALSAIARNAYRYHDNRSGGSAPQRASRLHHP